MFARPIAVPEWKKTIWSVNELYSDQSPDTWNFEFPYGSITHLSTKTKFTDSVKIIHSQYLYQCSYYLHT